MLNILKKSRNLINRKDKICIVLGNESCDLDSAVSAIAVAYTCQISEFKKLAPGLTTSTFLPVLNIPRNDYSLKTEVNYLLQKFSITAEELTFRDELSADLLKAAQFILVDHHNSPWSLQSVAVYDHRPRDESMTFPDNCFINIELVGSCCTIIADFMIKADLVTAKEYDIMQLLRSAIILDTANFSSTAQRTTPKDEMVCTILEEKLKGYGDVLPREELFDSLVKARGDVSNFTALQLLRKDMKIISAPSTRRKIALPGCPITIQQLLNRPQLEESILELARLTNVSVILLIGMQVVSTDGNLIERDLGLININDCPLFERVKRELLSSTELNLQLEIYSNCNFMGGCYYKQGNLKVTRKHILPLVQKLLMKEQLL